MKLRPTIAGIVMCLAVAACSSFQAYDGPPRPDSETSLIQIRSVSTRSGRGNIPPRSSFTSVDAQDLPNIAEVRVLPGGRCVTLRIVYTPYEGVSTARLDSILCFDAIAGRTYEVRGEIDEFTVNQLLRTWVVDLETGETVADGQLQSS